MSTVSGGRRRAFRSRHHTPMGQGGKLAVLFVSIALALFVFAVMLGNYLRGLAEDIIEDTTDAQSTEAQVYYANPPADMIGRGVFFGIDDSQAESTAEEETSEDEITSDTAGDSTAPAYELDPIKYDAVSVTLRIRDVESGKMRLSYTSEVSASYSIDEVGETELSEGLALIAANWGERTRVCGIFTVDHPNCPEQIRAITRAYEVALLCELVDAGFDEILLLGFSDNTDEALAFISDIYEQKGRGTAIGIGLSFDFVNAPDARTKLADVAQKCGFLVLDLASERVPALMNAELLISDRVSRTAAICREYSLRVLLGCGDLPDGDSQTRAALEAGARNVMNSLGISEK